MVCWKKSAAIFILFFPENRIWHFMHIVICSINKHSFIASNMLPAQSIFLAQKWHYLRASKSIPSFDDVASSDAHIYVWFLYQWGLVLTVIAIVIKRKDKLHVYSKTIVDYWGVGYDLDIHHRIQMLTSAITSVNIGILWWILDITLYPIPQ